MARTTIPLQTIVRTGLYATTPINATNSEGYQFSNDGRVFLVAWSTNATPASLTVQTAKLFDGYTVADQFVTVNASSYDNPVYAGPWAPGTFNQEGTSNVYVDSDIVADTLKIWAFYL